MHPGITNEEGEVGSGTAVITKRRTPLLVRVVKFKVEYRFRLVGTNGETIAVSEGYTAKHNAVDVCREYFPAFEIVDRTGE